MIKTIAFDCDDTLWQDSHLFDEAKDQFKSIIAKYTKEKGVREALGKMHVDNLKTYGYGAKSFTFAMIETAIDITDATVSASDIQEMINIGKTMLHTPMELLPKVEETLKKLAKMPEYRLMAITKGDLFAQEIKIERSGLQDYFDVIEIVSEKDSETYQEIFDLHDVDPKTTLMIGNSLKSDILPILELGAHGAHIPFRITWRHEVVEEAKINGKRFLLFERIDEVFDVLEKAKTITNGDFEKLYAVD